MVSNIPIDTNAVEEWFGDHEWKKPLINLNSIMACPIATEYFRLHCQKEFCEENFLAYIEVCGMKDATSGEELASKVSEFIQRYLTPGSPLEINVPYNFSAAMQEYVDKMLHENVHPEDTLDNPIERLKDHLVQNLNDPLFRFLDSEYLDECIPMCWYNKGQFSEKICRRPEQGKFLNKIITWTMPPRSALVVASSLLEMILEVLREHIKNNPTDFNYDKLVESIPWKKFIQHTCELQKVDLSTLVAVSERKAFFLNIYNTLILHAAVEKRGIPVANLNRTAFMRKNKYDIGGLSFSLDCIEHGVLRDNMKDWLLGTRFPKGDARAKLVVPIDPRVHFCLASVSISSPRVEIAPCTSEEDLNAFLDARTSEYLNKHVVVSTDPKTVHIPPVFSWFKVDFGKGKKEDHQQFVLKYTTALSEEQRRVVAGTTNYNYGKCYWVPSWDCVLENTTMVEAASATSSESAVVKPTKTIVDGSSNPLKHSSSSFSERYLEAKAFMKREIAINVFKKKAKKTGSFGGATATATAAAAAAAAATATSVN